MAQKRRRSAKAEAAAGNSEQKSGVPPQLLTHAFKPGQSGNPAGRPQGDGVIRKRLMKSFLDNEADALRAMAVRWRSPKYVQEMLELLAKLEGELSKDAAGDAGRGVAIIVLNNQGGQALDPEVFRQRVLERGALVVDERAE